MSCRHLTRNARPASFWRRALCGECRRARKADSLVAFALLCRRAEAAPLAGLKRTLAALDLPYSTPRPRRQRFGLLLRRTRRPAAILAGGTLALGFAWTRYIDIDPKIDVPAPAMHGPNAFDSFNRAANLLRDDLTVGKMLDQIKKRKDRAEKAAQQPASSQAVPPGSAAMSGMMSGGMMGGTPMPQAQSAPPAEEKEHEYTLEERADLVRANAPALAALREGLGRAYLAPPVRSSQARMPYLDEYRKLARLLRLESEVRAARGETGKAARSALDAIALGIEVEHSSPVMGKLVGVACEAIGRSALWDLIPRLSAAEATAAARRLEELSVGKPSTSDTFTEERWVLLASTLEMMRQPGWRESMLTPFGNESRAVAGVIYVTSLPYSKTRILNALDAHMNRLITRSNEPYAGPHSEEMPRDNPVPKLLENLLPEFTQFRFVDLKDDAENRLLAASLALRAYRLEHGKYPASLASLDSAGLKSVPRDPFGVGQPLGYRPAGTSYVLWSVGPDGMDQGGNPIRNTQAQEAARSNVLYDSYGDIVAGVNRS